jgi:hypothetical protein
MSAAIEIERIGRALNRWEFWMQRSSRHNIVHLVGTYLAHAIFMQAQKTTLSLSESGK